MDFHYRLTKRRRELGISIRKTCKKLKVAKSTYEKWETHRFPRHPNMYKKLSELFNIPLEYLMFGIEKNTEREEALLHFERLIKLLKDI